MNQTSQTTPVLEEHPLNIYVHHVSAQEKGMDGWIDGWKHPIYGAYSPMLTCSANLYLAGILIRKISVFISPPAILNKPRLFLV